MSTTPVRPTGANPTPAATRLAFHVRLPVVPTAESLIASGNRDTSAPRGMKVLNGILDKQSRRGWRRLSGRHRRNRLWLLSAIVVGLSGFALIFGLVGGGKPNAGSQEADVYAGDDFESESSATADASQVVAVPKSDPKPTAATAIEPPPGATVQSAVYQTTEPIAARTVWLDGTIVPDDSRIP